MSQQLTDNAAALRLFLTEDIYLIKGELSTKDISTVQYVKGQEPYAQVDSGTSAKVTPSLVQEPSEQIKKNWDFKFIGKNQKKVLILVNDAANDVSTEEGREVLRKLVKAIDLTGNDFALVNYANYYGASFDELKAFFECEVLMSFGVPCQDLQLPPSDMHQLVHYQNTKVLITQRLDVLDGSSKKVLWGSLQQLKS